MVPRSTCWQTELYVFVGHTIGWGWSLLESINRVEFSPNSVLTLGVLRVRRGGANIALILVDSWLQQVESGDSEASYLSKYPVLWWHDIEVSRHHSKPVTKQWVKFVGHTWHRIESRKNVNSWFKARVRLFHVSLHGLLCIFRGLAAWHKVKNLFSLKKAKPFGRVQRPWWWQVHAAFVFPLASLPAQCSVAAHHPARRNVCLTIF